jgi:N-glycosylase/DNA lyase
MPMSHANLSLANTLPVGQSFLWHRTPLELALSVKLEPGFPDHELPPTEEFSRALDNPARVLLLRQSSTKLYYTSVSPSTTASRKEMDDSNLRYLQDYFQLALFPSLPNMYVDWRERDPGLFGRLDVAADPRAHGIRVLRQDVWECLISYVHARFLDTELQLHHVYEQSHFTNHISSAQNLFSIL